MIAYRSPLVSVKQTNVVSDTMSLIINGEIVPQPTHIYYAFANNPSTRIDFTIGSNVSDCSYMFYNCANLNQNIIIPNTIYRCIGMFSQCKNLNQNIQIPNSVIFGSQMFRGCSKLNQNLVFPESMQVGQYLLSECTSLASTITFKGPISGSQICAFDNVRTSYNVIFKSHDVANFRISCFLELFKGSSTTFRRRNIYFNSILNSVFNAPGALFVDFSGDDWIYPTWTPMTNGFYNTKYNIYCYYNYSG